MKSEGVSVTKKRPRDVKEKVSYKPRVKMPREEIRFDHSLTHYPAIRRSKNQNKCRFEKCSLKTIKEINYIYV